MQNASENLQTSKVFNSSETASGPSCLSCLGPRQCKQIHYGTYCCPINSILRLISRGSFGHLGWPKPSQHLSTQLTILGVQTLDTHLFNLNPKPSPNLSCCMLLQNLHACKFVETAFRLCSSRLKLPSLKHDLSVALAQSSR